MEIAGKHALVTGGARRVGQTIVQALLRWGAQVTVHYNRSLDSANSLRQWADREYPRRLALFQADFTELGGLESQVSSQLDRLGPVEILINSASIFFESNTLQCHLKEWQQFLTINLTAPFVLSRCVAKHLSADGREGVIINLADINATHPYREHTPYVVSKAGLLMLTKNLALELAPKIRVNSISPGTVLAADPCSEPILKQAIHRTLLKRIGRPEDVAFGVKFLIENDYLTGFDLKIDGGREWIKAPRIS